MSHAKHLVQSLYRALDTAAPNEVDRVCARFLHSNAIKRTVHPLNDLVGPEEIAGRFWRPLRAAVPDLERRTFLLMAGTAYGGDWVSAMGVLEGAMTGSWLGIPAPNGLVNLRFAEFHRVEEGRVVEIIACYDLIDLMRQAGLQPLPATPLGAATIFPPPATCDGVDRPPATAEESAASLALMEAMIAGLMRFDGVSLASMGQERFWSPGMLWYGPGGVGSTRGLSGFQRCHQAPFLAAFPDRVGGNHKARFADGAYVASTGWPSIRATHHAPWLGVPGHGNPITMRVMDFWRREGDRLKENWVFIDVAHTLLQSGYDVFAALDGA